MICPYHASSFNDPESGCDIRNIKFLVKYRYLLLSWCEFDKRYTVKVAQNVTILVLYEYHTDDDHLLIETCRSKVKFFVDGTKNNKSPVYVLTLCQDMEFLAHIKQRSLLYFFIFNT
jgi:hypothetical protein